MSTIRDQIKTTFMGLAGLLSKMNVMQGSNPAASNTAILDAVGSIDIDTSDLAKQGSDTGATLSDVQSEVRNMRESYDQLSSAAEAYNCKRRGSGCD